MEKRPTILDHVNSEEEVFDNQPADEEKTGDLETGTRPDSAPIGEKDEESNGELKPASAVNTSA